MTSEKLPSEPSMEEILASIRQIISDDPRSERDSFGNPLMNEQNEDILDLTNLLPDEGSFFAKENERKSGSRENKEEALLLKNERPAPSLNPSDQHQSALPLEELLVSQAAAFEAVQSLQALRTLPQEKSRPFQSKEEMGGQSIENMVREMLKPLLKEWLDANLPSLVRWIVTEQVEKIVRQGTSFTSQPK